MNFQASFLSTSNAAAARGAASQKNGGSPLQNKYFALDFFPGHSGPSGRRPARTFLILVNMPVNDASRKRLRFRLVRSALAALVIYGVVPDAMACGLEQTISSLWVPATTLSLILIIAANNSQK